MTARCPVIARRPMPQPAIQTLAHRPSPLRSSHRPTTRLLRPSQRSAPSAASAAGSPIIASKVDTVTRPAT